MAATREGGPVEHAGKMVDEAKAFAAGISRRAEEIQQSVKEFDARGRINTHPVAFVGGALGVGYLLGGGLFSGTTGWLVKNGLRLVVLLPLAKMVFESSQDAAPKAPKRRPRARNSSKSS